MTSAGSPCNYGDWVTGLPGAPEWPVGANNKGEKQTDQVVYLCARVSHLHGVFYFSLTLCSKCQVCILAHPLDAVFVDTDAPEQGFKGFAECEGKEANRAELQTLSHLLQDGRRLLLDVISRLARLFGNLK